MSYLVVNLLKQNSWSIHFIYLFLFSPVINDNPLPTSNRPPVTLKCELPIMLKNRVVYKLTCPRCNACYVGQTGRQLLTRFTEHKNKSKQAVRMWVGKTKCGEHWNSHIFVQRRNPSADSRSTLHLRTEPCHQ